MAALEKSLNSLIKDQRNAIDDTKGYPRAHFHRLTFPVDVSGPDKVRWKNKFQHELYRLVGMPKKEKWYFKYIYVNRRHPDLLENLQGGHYGGYTSFQRMISTR